MQRLVQKNARGPSSGHIESKESLIQPFYFSNSPHSQHVTSLTSIQLIMQANIPIIKCIHCWIKGLRTGIVTPVRHRKRAVLLRPKAGAGLLQWRLGSAQPRVGSQRSLVHSCRNIWFCLGTVFIPCAVPGTVCNAFLCRCSQWGPKDGNSAMW